MLTVSSAFQYSAGVKYEANSQGNTIYCTGAHYIYPFSLLTPVGRGSGCEVT